MVLVTPRPDLACHAPHEVVEVTTLLAGILICGANTCTVGNCAPCTDDPGLCKFIPAFAIKGYGLYAEISLEALIWE